MIVTHRGIISKSQYKNDFSDLLEKYERENSKLKNDVKSLREENEQLKSKLKKKCKECNRFKGNILTLQLRVTGLIGKYHAVIANRQIASDKLNELENEVNRVRNLLHEAGNMHLESDEKEKPEINTQRQANLSEQYEVKLQDSVQELRNQCEGQMEAIRDIIDEKEKNIRTLQLIQASNANVLRCIHKRIDARNKTIIELNETNAALSSQIQKLKQMSNNYDNNNKQETLVRLEANL
ncbi:hypothetical protein GQX74_001775 [Glossina fuscipes]|nr:hypothetical protein GQX74_001775 [Glossina fuscipes]